MANDSFITAADTANMQAGGKSFLDSASDVFTKGVSSAVVSGLYGIVNTGVDLSNKVFGTELEHADTSETMHSLDNSWGDYYDQNKGAIDVAGFVGASLVPGMLAVKGLKAVQAGNSFGTFGRVLGYTNTMEQKYLTKALGELATEGGTIFNRINASKATSIAWGVADNVLQTAAFETAVAVTMKSSPMLENEDWSHILSDMAKTSLTGGFVGGAINGLITNKIFKDAGKLVDMKQRGYDVLSSAGKVNLQAGDEVMGIADAVLNLPKEVLEAKIPFKQAKDGVLDTSGLMDKTLKQSVTRGVLKLEGSLTNIVATDPTIGRPLAKALVDIVKNGMENNVAPENIRRSLGDHLYNLHSVEGIGSRPLDVSGELRYLDPAASLVGDSKRVPFTDTMPDKLTNPRVPVNTYRVIGDESQARQGVLGREALTPEDAWKAGLDTVVDPTSGRILVSPFSEVYKQVDAAEAQFAPMFLNTKTLKTSLDTVPTIADIQTLKVKLTPSVGGVQSGTKNFAFTTAFKAPADSIEATARHLWANELKNIYGKVDNRDISLMDALAAHPERAGNGLQIYDAATDSSKLFTDFMDFPVEAFKSKYAVATKLLEDAGTNADLRDIAYKTNVSGEWLQEAIANKLDINAAYHQPGWNQDLANYWHRENLILRYDTAAVERAALSPTAEVAYATRVQEAQGRAVDASNIVLGEKSAALMPDLAAQITKTADSQGVGASLFGASNAGYADKLRASLQYVGQQVGTITNERVTAALTRIQSPAAKLLQNPSAAAEVSAATTQARLSTDAWALYTDSLSGKKMMVDLESYKKIQKGGQIQFAKRIELSDDAGAFIAAHQDAHKLRIEQQTVLGNAQGLSTRWDPDKLYFPPVDTQRVPFFAFVRQGDGTIFGSSEVAMITARDASELTAKAAAVERSNPTLQVIYKSDTEVFHKAKADYDFSRTMNEPVLDSTLRKQGLLGDYLPNMTPEAVVNDFIQYTQRAETKLVRDAVSVRYAQQFAELSDLSERYTASQTSKFEGLNKWLKGSVQDPFGDYMKLAMNISKRGEFTLLHQANEFVDALGSRAYRGVEKAFLDARGGQISWQEANDQLVKFGMGAHFTDKEIFEVAQSAPDRNLIKGAVQKANMLLSTGMLRLDFANSLLNIISTPVLLGTEVSALRNSLKKDPELFAQFNSMLAHTVPNTEIKIPSTSKLVFNAVAASVGEGSKEFFDRFRAIGTVKGPAALYHEMTQDLSLLPNMVPGKYAATVDKWVERGANITFSNQAEDYTRFVTSHVMWQLTEPIVKKGAMTVQEQNAFMTIFTNRVQGNYVAAQRPILFQGTIGSAIGLFQTYQFNLFQQLFRHIENKDLKTIATMGALQGTIFGANGLPMFDAINTQLVGNASINEKHSDAYSYAVQAAGKPIGDWLLYGTASAFPLWSEQAPALWTRGDLNPRSAFVVPTNPLDVPAVAATLKVVQGVLGMAQQIGTGASASDALLFGLEHNGINRPLTGLAQVLKGSSTTSKGDLISASADWLSISNASRIMGAKPMDESIALTSMFRSKAYQATDKARIDSLGTVIKDKLRNNETLSPEDWIDFQGKYAAAGGRIQGFSQAMQRWDKGANVSIVNEVMRHSQTPAGQRMIEVMGGDPLKDYTNQTGTTDTGE